MSFNVMAVRTGEAEDGRMYPVLGDERSLVELEPSDGDQNTTVVATSISVRHLDGSNLRAILNLTDIKAEVTITDARIIVACEKYTKGGGWIGFGGAGIAVALAANAVSKARAAHRRKGKVLVGHVRYPWLRTVGFSAKTGWGTNESLRIGLADGTKRSLYLDLRLPRDIEAAAVAQAIARRTADYRLRFETDGMSDEHQAGYRDLSQAQRLSAVPKKFVFYTMPTFRYAIPGTATPKSVGSS